MRNTPQTTTNLIVPPTWGYDIDQALLDELMSVSDEELKKMWDAYEQTQKQLDQKKRKLDPAKISLELPKYTQEIRQNFLNLKWIDAEKLKKIDECVSDMEKKWYIKRCSYEWWLMVMVDIPWCDTFRYFEPNFKKYSLNAYYKWLSSSPFCQDVSRNFWDVGVKKNEIKKWVQWVIPLRTRKDAWDDYYLYEYISKTMHENNFSFVSFHHDRKFLKILLDYYKKSMWDADVSINDLVAMRSRVLLSWGYWLLKDERWCKSWVVECYDDHCWVNLNAFGPDEFNYISFLLTDMKLVPDDYANGYRMNHILHN